MFNDAPPSREDVTTSRTWRELVDVKTFTSSGMIAPASVPQVITVESFHHREESPPRSGISIQETSGTAAPITSLMLHFFTAAGAPSVSVPGTSQPTTIPGGSTLQTTGFVTQNTPTGGQVEFEFIGTDAFGRAFSFKSPRLVYNTFAVPGVAGIGNLAGQSSVTGVIRQGGGLQPAASSGTIRRQR